jgi:predicted RNA binding protein YcfA (HicA-like mRNA interferase family)
MGRRKYPPLTPSEVIAILEVLGFSFKRQTGSHRHYERAADDQRPRSVVTVDVSVPECWEELIKSMVRQSNCGREDFYGATARTKKKIQ